MSNVALIFFPSSRTKLTASSFHIAVTGMYSCCMIVSKCEVWCSECAVLNFKFKLVKTCDAPLIVYCMPLHAQSVEPAQRPSSCSFL